MKQKKRWNVMRDMVLDTSILPEPLYTLIPSEKIRVREVNGELRIIPILQPKSFNSVENPLTVKHVMTQTEYKAQRLSKLRGSGADLQLTVDSFLKMTHDMTETDVRKSGPGGLLLRECDIILVRNNRLG